MKHDSMGIAAGGEQRLRKAVEADVRRRHQEEMAAAVDQAQRTAIEEKVRREIRERLERVASPSSLWNS